VQTTGDDMICPFKASANNWWWYDLPL
jgi:hypothetical protein